MALVLIPYLVCACAYGVLLALLLAQRRISRIGRFFLAACLATIIWALTGASFGALPLGLAMAIGTASTTTLLIFLCCLLAGPEIPLRSFFRRNEIAILVPVAGLVTIGVDLRLFLAGSGYWQVQLIGRLVLAVLGISLIENLYRNTNPDDRWAVRPLCIGMGSIFAFDLYFFSDALLLRHIQLPLLTVRAVICTLAVPLFAMTMVRNANWQVRIRVSRDAVFHGVTLVASGIFLLSVAVIGIFVRRYGGEWALILQVSALFGSGTVLVLVLSSGTARSYFRNFILKNFFPYRYDYRVEWMKFIDTLSFTEGVNDLPERVIRSIADIMNSTGGALFQRRENVFVPVAQWNTYLPADANEPEASAFMSRFHGGGSIQQLLTDEFLHRATERPAWLAGRRFWLAIPLMHNAEIIGFVVLLEPRAPVELDWEVFELLHTVARQAASYLAERESATALADAKLLEDYSKRFAFVVHDIKNLSSQLELVVSNARRHGDDPEFRADVMLTIEHSVGRMNKLLSQLKAGKTTAPLAVTDVAAVIDDLVALHSTPERIRVLLPPERVTVRMDPGNLLSALTHVVSNALEASAPLGVVSLAVRLDDGQALIEITDQGPGMEMGFVRNSLFRPFRTTKKNGYGIGAFQTRDIVRSAGGKFEVLSTPGTGTTARIVLEAAAPAVSVAGV